MLRQQPPAIRRRRACWRNVWRWSRRSRIPPDICEGLHIARGTGAVSILGDILAGHGGLDPDDFSMVIGFFPAGKDVSQFASRVSTCSTCRWRRTAKTQMSTVLPDRKPDVPADARRRAATASPPTRNEHRGRRSPGTTAVIEPFTETNAYERGFVVRIVLRDRRSRAVYGIDLGSIAPAAADSGWPPHSLVGVLGPSVPACLACEPGGIAAPGLTDRRSGRSR